MNAKIIKKGFLLILAIGRSLFNSVTAVAWGLVSIFSLSLIISYFIKEGKPLIVDKLFLQIELFIAGHILLFTLIFFIWYLWNDYQTISWRNQ